MGTLVQSPDRAAVQVSGLQAIDRPESAGSLGTFLSGILPAVNQELDKYDEGSRDRLVALGRVDQLNGVMNEVGLLDRRNYKAGRGFQLAVNGQIDLATKFQAEVTNSDPATFDPDALIEKAKQFTNDSVNNVANSDLPDDMKKVLYDSNLKENATYMTMVDKKIKQITADNATTARTNSRAELTRNLGNTEFTVPELTVSLEAFVAKRTEALRIANPDMTLEEIDEEVNADIKAAFTYNLDTLKTSGQAEDITRLEYFSALSDSLISRDLGLALQLQEKANQFSSEIRTNQVSNREYETAGYLNERKVNPDMWQDEDVRSYVGQLMGDTSIDLVARNRIATSVLNAYADHQKSVLNADVILDPRQESITSYKARGDSQSDYDRDIIASFLKEFPNQPAVGAIKALDFFSRQAEYSDTGVREASKIVFSTLTGYARLSDAEVAADEFSQMRRDQFAITAQLYNKFKGENVSKAYDLLSGVPPEYMDAFSAAFETGKNLEDVRRMFQNPVSTAEVYASIEKALNDTAGVNKALGLGNELGSGFGGFANNSMSDGLEPFYTNDVATALKGSKAFFAGNTQIGTATSLISKFAQADGLIASSAGYSSIIMDLGVAKQVNGWKVTGTNTPIHREYFPRSVDSFRRSFAEKHKMSPSNIIVKSDATGQQMRFMVYESTGLLGKGEPRLVTEENVTMAIIKKGAETLLGRDKESKSSATGQAARYSNTAIGRADITDLSFNGKATNVNVTAPYAQAFGGNLLVATMWVNHMQRYENFTSKGVTAKDANTGRVSTVYGHGMTSATLQNPSINMLAEVQQARGNPQAMVNVQGKFVQKYYNGLDKSLKAVGVPMPSSGVYQGGKLPSLMLVLDGLWHAGTIYGAKRKDGSRRYGLIDAMNAPNYATGRKILQGLSTFNRAKVDSSRNKFMEAALIGHFKSRGLN